MDNDNNLNKSSTSGVISSLRWFDVIILYEVWVIGIGHQLLACASAMTERSNASVNCAITTTLTTRGDDDSVVIYIIYTFTRGDLITNERTRSTVLRFVM